MKALMAREALLTFPDYHKFEIHTDTDKLQLGACQQPLTPESYSLHISGILQQTKSYFLLGKPRRNFKILYLVNR